MNDEFNEKIDIKPDLTFEPFQQEESLAIDVEEKIEETIIDDVHLTEEELVFNYWD